MKITLGTFESGAAGTAREVLVDIQPPDPPDWQATIGSWFIVAPGQSPAWSCFALSAIHLRAIEGVKPALIKQPGATHEFILAALDPSRKPDPLDPDSWQFLTPLNLCEQLSLPSDAAAAKLLRICVLAVMKGTLWAEPMLIRAEGAVAILPAQLGRRISGGMK
jgi:hypothetical protein